MGGESPFGKINRGADELPIVFEEAPEVNGCVCQTRNLEIFLDGGLFCAEVRISITMIGPSLIRGRTLIVNNI